MSIDVAKTVLPSTGFGMSKFFRDEGEDPFFDGTFWTIAHLTRYVNAKFSLKINSA